MSPGDPTDGPSIEVLEIDRDGICVAIGEDDVIVRFEDFPALANAPVSAIFDVEMRRPGYLFWPRLDLELSIESIPRGIRLYGVSDRDAGSVRETPPGEGSLRVRVPHEAIARFCRERGIGRLAFFGSVTRDDFTPESDVDVLVEFLPGRVPSLFKIVAYQDELSGLLGRQVDLHTFKGLNEYIRDEGLAEAVDEYVAP